MEGEDALLATRHDNEALPKLEEIDNEPSQSEVISGLLGSGVSSFIELCEASDLSVPDIRATLTMMSLRGEVFWHEDGAIEPLMVSR